MTAPKPQQARDLYLKIGRTDGMLPHVPTPEMVANHRWHVYDRSQKFEIFGNVSDMLCFTGTRAECAAYIERVSP